MEDANFSAYIARSDLAKAGVKCIPGLKGRVRALPQGLINMDNVKLIVVSRDSPYSSCDKEVQHGVEPSSTSLNTSSADKEDYAPHDYAQLLTSSKHFYSKSGRIPTPSEEGADKRYRYFNASECGSNTTGTITPLSGGSDSGAEWDLEIPAKVNHRGTVSAQDDKILPKKSLNPVDSMTMESAIMCSDAAR